MLARDQLGAETADIEHPKGLSREKMVIVNGWPVVLALIVIALLIGSVIHWKVKVKVSK